VVQNWVRPKKTASKLLAISAIWLVCGINCYSILWTQRITKVFGYIKIFSLVFIVGLGVYGVAVGKGDLSVFKPVRVA